MVSDGGEGGQDAAQWALRFISGQIPGRRVPAAAQPRDHHRPLVRPRHGARRGHGVAQARQDHHRRQGRDDPGSRLDERHVRQRREGAQGRAQGRRPHPDRHVDHQARLRRRRADQPPDRDRSALEDGGGRATSARPRRRSRWRAASRRSRCPTCCSCCRPARSPACSSCAPTRHVGKLVLPQGADLLRQHRDQLQHRPAQGDDPHAGLDAGLVRAGAARRARGARRDGRLDRGRC